MTFEELLLKWETVEDNQKDVLQFCMEIPAELRPRFTAWVFNRMQELLLTTGQSHGRKTPLMVN